MIEARKLRKVYGHTVAVDGIDFQVKPGHVTGFLGPNGAGKSTTMRMILGLDLPTSGTVTVGGRRYQGRVWPLHEVGALLDARAVHPGRSAYDHMPRLDGVAATRALLRGAAPVPTRVVMLTTFHTDEYVTDALRAGASGFLLKEATADQFVDAVRVVAEGEAMLAPSVTRRLLERMAEDPAQSPHDADEIRNLLSAREIDVLLLVARGLSNAEISAQLHLAETTVKSHVQSMLAKLGVRDRLQAAVAAYDSGLVRPGGGLHGG